MYSAKRARFLQRSPSAWMAAAARSDQHGVRAQALLNRDLPRPRAPLECSAETRPSQAISCFLAVEAMQIADLCDFEA